MGIRGTTNEYGGFTRTCGLIFQGEPTLGFQSYQSSPAGLPQPRRTAPGPWTLCTTRFTIENPRALNIIDESNREILAIEIDTSLLAGRVIPTLE
jgi:hypothetical protein